MIIRAELKCKQTGCEADTCAVDKVIELPSPRFQQFSLSLIHISCERCYYSRSVGVLQPKILSRA